MNPKSGCTKVISGSNFCFKNSPPYLHWINSFRNLSFQPAKGYRRIIFFPLSSIAVVDATVSSYLKTRVDYFVPPELLNGISIEEMVFSVLVSTVKLDTNLFLVCRDLSGVFLKTGVTGFKRKVLMTIWPEAGEFARC